MAKTFVGKNIERGVNSITTPVNEESSKLKKMNRKLKKAKKPGMEGSITIKDLQAMETALAAINAILNKVDVTKVNKLISGARKFIRATQAGMALAKLAASAPPFTPVGGSIETMAIGKTYIEDGEETIDGVALPAMVGTSAQLSNSKGLVTENATLIKDAKVIKEKGVDPKQAWLASKWTMALREGWAVSFYLNSVENKKFVDEDPQRYQSLLVEAKATGQLSKVQVSGDINILNIQNRMKVEVENHYLMANLQSDYNEYHDMVNELKRKEEDIEGYISDDPVMFAEDIEELNGEISQLKSSRDQSGSRLLETKKTYKDNLTTLKSIGDGKSPTGMLNSSEVYVLEIPARNSLADAVQSAIDLARYFSRTLGMNVTYIDKAEPSEKFNFQLMWDLSKDQNGMFKLVIVLENRPA
tara:strand:+ start:1708 stop:2952 length:1245 start_codon:yes stop_codon:yes gene_type:complete